MRLVATATDLPPAVAAALATPRAGDRGQVDAAGTLWPTLSWGDPSARPVVLVHGVTSNAGIWWRVGPAIAASGRYVVAIDMPGHGETARGARSHVLLDTATELAGFIRAGGLDRPDLAVVGHSWGGMVASRLPAAGLAPHTLVLLDPPWLTLERLRALTQSPSERTYSTLADAIAAVHTENPTWSDGDVAAKAQALTEFDPQLVLDVLLKNGNWDAGLSAIQHPNAAASDVWLIRGEWATGGFIPESRVARYERRIGADHVITIEGAPHSPQRTHPEATVLAILRALG